MLGDENCIYLNCNYQITQLNSVHWQRATCERMVMENVWRRTYFHRETIKWEIVFKNRIRSEHAVMKWCNNDAKSIEMRIINKRMATQTVSAKNRTSVCQIEQTNVQFVVQVVQL